MIGVQGSGSEYQEFARDVLEHLFPPKETAVRMVLKELLQGPVDTYELMARLARVKEIKERRLNTEISEARKRLEQFYLGPVGFAQQLRVEIPDTKKFKLRSISVVKNIPPQGPLAFWGGHLATGKPTKLIAAQPVFFEVEDKGLLIHHEASDGEASDELEVLRTAYPGLAEGDIRRIRPYVALADVHAILCVFTFLDALSRRSEQPAPAVGSVDDLAGNQDANLFVIGTPFNSEAIRQLEIDALDHRSGTSSLRIHPSRTMISKTMGDGAYRAWVVRRWSGSTVQTLINASESVVLEAVCKFLTSEEEMQKFISERWQGPTWKGFPAEFQMEFLVRLTRDGRKTKSIRVGKYWDMPGWARGSNGIYQRAGGKEHLPGKWRYPWD